MSDFSCLVSLGLFRGVISVDEFDKASPTEGPWLSERGRLALLPVTLILSDGDPVVSYFVF